MHEEWYKSAIFYAIDVEKFADGDGDGVGDFHGLLEHLDYIDQLGVTCVWLLPFYPSPRRDNGYDVTDYYSVDPRLGTLDDVVTFVRAAGERGIRVMVDLVMNHTSDEHPWFQAARRDRASRFRGYYTWTDSPDVLSPHSGHGSAFPGEEHSVWTFDETAGQFYYHPFYSFEPDLDFDNAEVVTEAHRVMDFWLSFGVAGFRMDAVPIMLGLDGPRVEQPRDPHGILRGFARLAAERRPGAVLLGEVDVDPGQLVKYFGDGDELNMLLNFLLNDSLFLALTTERSQPVLRALEQLPAPPPHCQWVNFLRNLDELNLGWLSAEDRETVCARLAPDEGMRIYARGIRRRLAPLLDGDRARLELAFSLLFSLPGSPLLTYGDEIGLGDDLSVPG